MPHSSFHGTASHQENARLAPALSPSPAPSAPLTGANAELGPGLANPTPEQHQALLSLLTQAPQGNPEYSTARDSSIAAFPQGAPPVTPHDTHTIKRGHCPTSVLIWIFSWGGGTSVLWGFDSLMSASGARTKRSSLEAKDGCRQRPQSA